MVFDILVWWTIVRLQTLFNKQTFHYLHNNVKKKLSCSIILIKTNLPTYFEANKVNKQGW